MLMKLKSGLVRSDMHIIRTKIAYFSAMCIAVMLSFTGYVQSQIANDMDLLTETDTTSRIVEIFRIQIDNCIGNPLIIVFKAKMMSYVKGIPAYYRQLGIKRCFYY